MTLSQGIDFSFMKPPSFSQSTEELRVVLSAAVALAPQVDAAGEAIVASLKRGGKLLTCGNGGSAADAQHLAAEFVGRYLVERRPLPALALHANTSALTAIGNDYGYEQVFARPLEALARPGDVLVALSTSGNSPSIVAAARKARDLGLTTIALTGAGGGQMASWASILLAVPSTETPRIQENHILIGHCLCQAVEQALFG